MIDRTFTSCTVHAVIMRDNDYPDSDWYSEIRIPVDELRNHYLELALEIIERYFATLQELRLFPFTISISNYTISVVLLPHNVSLESRIYLCTNSFLIRTVEYNPTRKLML